MLRKLSIAFALATLLLLLAAGILWMQARQVDLNAHRGRITEAISRGTGLDWTISGEIELEFGLFPGITARGLEVRHPDPRWIEPLARVERVALEIDLWKALLRGLIELREADASGIRLNLRVDEAGLANWRGVLPVEAEDEPKTGLPLEILDIGARDVRVQYRDDGSGLAVDGQFDQITVVADTEQDLLLVSVVGKIEDQPISLQAELERHLLPKAAAGKRTRVAAVVVLPYAQLTVVGTSGGEELERGLDLRVEGHAETLEPVVRWLNVPMRLDGRQVGPVRLNARVTSAVGLVDVPELELEVGGPGEDWLLAMGSVANVLDQPRAELRVQARLEDLDDLLARSELPVWGVGVVEASGDVTVAQGVWEAQQLQAKLVHRAGTVGRVSGRLARDSAGSSGELDARLDADTVGQVLAVFEPLLPELRRDQEPPVWRRAWQDPVARKLGPVEARGRLAGSLEDASLSDLDVSVGTPEGQWARGRGAVRELLRGRGLALDLEAGTSDLQSLLEHLELHPVALRGARFKGHLTNVEGPLSLQGVELEARRGERLVLSAAGDVSSLGVESVTNWRVGLHASDVSQLERLFERSFRDWGAPIDLRARLDASAARVDAREVELSLDRSRFHGSVRVEMERRPRPLLHVRLESKHVRLKDLGIEPDPAGQDESAAAPPSPDPDDLLPFEDLRRFDADLQVRSDSLTGRNGLNLSNLGMRLELRDGVLEAEDLRLRWHGGEVRASVRIDARSRPARQIVRLRTSGADLAQVLAQLTREEIATGQLEVVADLSSSGDSRKQIMEGLAGELFVHVYGGEVHTKYSHALQFNVLEKINPNLEVPEVEVLNCFVADFSVAQGRLDISTWLLDTFYIQVLASGYLDLPGWKLRIVLTPVFKQKTPGSVAAAITVRGSLSNPIFIVEPFATASAATKGAVNGTLKQVERVFPRVSATFDRWLRSSGEASEDLIGVGDLWTPGKDVSCELVLAQERIERARSIPIDLSDREHEAGR